MRAERASATVEHAGLVALIAVLLLVGIAALAATRRDLPGGRELGGTIARRLVCAPHLPDSCRHHPLVTAYGWPLARLVRALAPPPAPRTGPGGLPLVPVDFRRCRRASCAIPRPGPDGAHLTQSGRRTTVFTSIEDHRRAGGPVEISYWLYRPGLGWELHLRSAWPSDVAAASRVRVLIRDDPNLVPLETLPGRNHYDFPPGEEPPWRWRVPGRYPGWSS
jgi:hypothetical protein